MWNFTLRLNQPFTKEQAEAFDYCDAFADGSASYVLSTQGIEECAAAADDDELLGLICKVEALSLVDAIAQMSRSIQLIPGLRAVGAKHDDIVTLGHAAQRCARSEESLVQLARNDPDFPKPEPGITDTDFYSWRKIAAFLRGIGDDAPDVVPDLALADRVLGLVEQLRNTEIPAGTLRSLGLTAT